MANQEPTTKEIMKVVVGVKENTEQILEAIGIFSNNVEKRFDRVETKLDDLEKEVKELKRETAALSASVKNYLELSDKRYLELRQTNRIIFKYLKLVVQKTKVPIDLKELESLVS